MLKLRLLFGLMMAFAVLGIMWLDHRLAETGTTTASPGFLILGLIAGGLGSWEFYALAKRVGARPFAVLGTFLICGCWLAAWWVGWSTTAPPYGRGEQFTALAGAMLAFSVALGIALVFLAQGLRGETHGATLNIATTLLGVLYLGVLGGFVMLLRFAVGPVWNLVIFLAIVKWTDIGAYFVGRAFGKHKLIYWLSPGKTWEGTAGGLAMACLLAVGFGLLHEPLHWLPVGASVAFALPVSAVGQLGDLAKSLLKRDAGVKDSSSAIPGFGGVLDVIDSPLMAAPVAYVLWTVLWQWGGA
jgi:phosphatidate cytidylyltransferase